MPELPEVETTRRGISPHIEGKRVKECIVRNSQLRWPVPFELAQTIEGKRLLRVERRGKYLLLHFNHGTALWHLGMSGNLRIVDSKTGVAKHDHVDWVFDKNTILRFNDPRRFGSLLWTDQPVAEHKLISHLGPEPLSDEFDGDYLFKQSRHRKQAVKTWLMNSSMVVGVGNIYANESLFASRIHPTKAAAKLSKNSCVLLAENIKTILARAITRGGTTLKDFVGGDGKPGYFAQELNVYGKGGEPCILCTKPLTEKAIAQRATVYCTHCQK